MEQRPNLSIRQINHDLLQFVLVTPLWFWIVAAILALTVGAGMVVFGLMLDQGLGLLGYTRPVYWAVLITNFVFWVGISHAGVMISAILRLSQAEWRRPVTRAAEVLTLFALATAALFPVLHTGRQWRTFYWVFPYDFARNVWPDVRSPLVWDPSAVFTYLTSSALFVFVMLLPDLAIARDNSTGLRHLAYSVLSLGYRGNVRQWRLQIMAGILLSALVLPIFVSVHSIVSWDFAMALVPGWHATLFAPYFVIGAVHSGVSAVVTVMAILRRAFHLQPYIRSEHFDCLGRLLLLVSNTWFFFYLLDTFFALYSRENVDVAVVELRFFGWPYSLLAVIFFLCAYFIPVPLWLFRRVRRSVAWMFWTTILVNIGMWLERFLIIVPGLDYKQPLTFTWGEYGIKPAEIVLTAAAVAFVALGFLVFAKVFPIIPVSDVQEGQLGVGEIQVGRVRVPAAMRDLEVRSE